MKLFLKFIAAGACICLFPSLAGAQVKDSLLVAAREYMNGYDYEQALRCYNEAEYYVADSLGASEIDEQTRRCDTLRSVSSTAPVLNVVSRARFSKDDFFLYYPLPDESFRPVEGGGVVYWPGSDATLYLDRAEAENQFLPVTVGDCKYFSKKSDDGFGGYDLYCCKWDEALGEWGEAQNLGFPYSSTGNDFLFMDTGDGRFSLFASDRSCGADSVYVYVIDRTMATQTASLSSGQTRSQLAELLPNVDSGTLVRASSTGTDPLIEQYQGLVDREKELKTRLAATEDEERKAALQRELEGLAREKKAVEESIFENNTQTRTISEEVDRDLAGVEGSFIFFKRKLGAPVKIILTQD